MERFNNQNLLQIELNFGDRRTSRQETGEARPSASSQTSSQKK